MYRSILRQTVLIATLVPLFMAPALPVAAEEFEIIHLLKPQKKYDGPATLALVAGGYRDGLEEGLKGLLWRPSYPVGLGRPAPKPLEVVVMDAAEFVSSCWIRGETSENIRSGRSVGIDIPNLDALELRRRADQALAQGDYNRSLHYLTELTKVDGAEIDSTVDQLAEQCRQAIDDEANRKVSRKEKRALKKQADQNHTLGTYFFNTENYDAARWYFEKVVRGDKKQEYAKYMLSLIKEAKHRLSLREEGLLVHQPPTEEFKPVEVFPEMVYQASPKYPKQAKQNGITGVVWVKALVDKSGSVLDVLIHKSSGTILLDQAAVKAARKCRYKPGIQDGRPINCWVTYKVEFELGP